MSEVATYAVLGAGIIGGELPRQLGHPEVAEEHGLKAIPQFVLRSSGVYVPGEAYDPTTGTGLEKRYDDFDEIPDEAFPTVLFNALPSDMSHESRWYMTKALEVGSLVVTAEKAALAEDFTYFNKISKGFTLLGDNATVGGGTQALEAILPFLRDIRNVTQIHGVFNGTSQDMANTLTRGRTPGQAVQQARQMGYAEPNATSFHDVLRGEAKGDIPKKTSHFFNRTGLSNNRVLSPHVLEFRLTDDDITRFIEEAPHRRLITSYYNLNHRKVGKEIQVPESDIIGGFRKQCGDWLIISGFRDVRRNGMFQEAATLDGPGNVVTIGLGPGESDGGITVSKGPGAGAAPTVRVMIDDWLRIRGAASR